MKIVAHMLCRNEADIIAETVREIMRWTGTLIVLDGASTDGTLEILQERAEYYRTFGATFVVESRPDPEDRFADHIRNELLALTQPFVQPGDWVISVDADEIWHSGYDHNGNDLNPLTAIRAADAAGANVVRAWVPQFWLTFQDLDNGALHEDERESIQKRRRYYSWGHMGTFIWKWNPDHYYPRDVQKRTPELPGKTWREWQRAGPLVPICKHYCLRTTEQGRKRAAERLARGGAKYFGKYKGRLVIDAEKAGLHFLEWDAWNTENNHDALHAYMNGA